MAKQFAIGVLLEGKDKSRPVTDGIGRISRSAKQAQGRLGGLTSGFGALGTAIKAFVAWKSVTAGWDFLNDVADQGDKIAKFSRVVGLSAQALQEWRYAGELAGVGSDTFDRAAKRLSIQLGDVQTKSGGLYKFLKKEAPVLLEQFQGANPDEAFGLSIRALEKIPDPARRAALAVKFFGKALGPEMVKFAEAGSKEIGRSREEARQWGLYTDKALDESEKWNDDVFRLKSAFGGLKVAIGEELLPVLRPMVVEFATWVKDNKGEVAKKIGGAVRGIAEWLRGIDWKAVGKGIGSFLESAGKALDAIGGIKGALLFIGAMKLGGLILEVGKLGTALSGIATGPIGLIIAGLAAVAIGLDDAIGRIDEAERRLREQRQWRKGMHEEADRKTDEAFGRAGVTVLAPGEERKTLLQPGQGPTVSSGSQLGRLFGDLAFAGAMRDYANGKLGADEFAAVDRAYTGLRKDTPSVAGGTDFLSAANNLLEDARDAQLGLGQSQAVEVNLSVTVPAGTEVDVQAKGKGKVTTRERRTGRRRIGG